ncbi:MAG: hypothetical protein ABSE95_16695 [Thermodesulfobacteriota bacterium]|jgi:hypothetical protein
MKEKDRFKKETSSFLRSIFNPALKNGYGKIMVRYYTSDDPGKSKLLLQSPEEAAEHIFLLKKTAMNADIYFGINPRVIEDGRISIKYVSTIHAIVNDDYPLNGLEIEGKPSGSLISSPWPPSFVLDIGDYLHYFWNLNEPVSVDEIGRDKIEGLNS